MEKIHRWKRFSKYYRFYDEINLGLDISRMSFADTFIDSIVHRVRVALNDMVELENGTIANPDEGRMVGHYWLRNSSIAPSPQIKLEIDNSLKCIKTFAQSVMDGTYLSRDGTRFSQAVIVGIGGSALGPQLLYDAFGVVDRGLRLFFCDNTDPDGIKRLLDQILPDLPKTLFIVISKSGGTVETRNGMLEIEDYCQRNSTDFASRAIAITCIDSKLDKLAKESNWLNRFYIWDWVGGRTSIFSSVGLLPAALHGLNIDEFLRGAKAMDQITRSQDIDNNPATMLAMMWFYGSEGAGKRDMVVIPYKDRLLLFSRYLQQLIMESLGKRYNSIGEEVLQGLTVYGNKGSTDQHAYIQQLRDGLANFFVTFVEVLRDGDSITHLEVEPGITSGDYLDGFYLGTREALSASGRESISIIIKSLDEVSMGALIALFERTVGLYASIIGINAYNQPGVEAGKKAASEIIALQLKIVDFLKTNSGQSYKIEDIASQIESREDCEIIFKVLEHMVANSNRDIAREGRSDPIRAKYMHKPRQ